MFLRSSGLRVALVITPTEARAPGTWTQSPLPAVSLPGQLEADQLSLRMGLALLSAALPTKSSSLSRATAKPIPASNGST